MNFKSLREDKLKYTKEQMAKLCNVDLATIDEWEENNNPPMKAIEDIAKGTGLDFNSILSYEKPVVEKIVLKDNWQKADFTKKTLFTYIDDNLDKLNISKELREKYLDELQEGLNQNLIKPKISFVGRSDTGKSTLINSLLGENMMPASWTPTTSIAVYLKHSNDKPNFMKNNVCIFSSTLDGEDAWNEKKIYEKEYYEAWKIAEGDIDLLLQYGTRQGGKQVEKAGAAIVFIDAPILLNCDIIDLPGFGTEQESDDIITFNTAKQADVLIYLSQASGFMRIEDINYLKENIRSLTAIENERNKLPKLANLLVVASQAHNVNYGNRDDLKLILDNGCERFIESISDDYWKSRTSITKIDYSIEDLRKRFVTYTKDIPDLCKDFEEKLKTVIEELPLLINERARVFAKNYVDAKNINLENELKKYEDLITQRDRYVNLINEIEKNELKRKQDNSNKVESIRSKISDLKHQTIDDFSDYCSKTITVDSIVKMLKDKKVKNNKESVECFVSKFQDGINSRAAEILQCKSDELTPIIREYVQSFSNSINQSFDKSNLNVDFDAGHAFASIIAKIGVIGGLGAYLIADALLVYSGWAFFAGLGGVICSGATFFGPLGIMIGALLFAGMGIAKLLGFTWEKNVAKKLVAQYEKNKVSDKYREAMNKYWDDTSNAFDKAVIGLNKQWDDYVSKLKEMVTTYDLEELKANIISLRNIQDFFANIPL